MASERRKQEVQDREQQVWRLRVSGLTQCQIAEQLDITQPAVCQILHRVGERLAAEFVEEARTVKMQQTAILDGVLGEALTQWRRSYEDAVTEVTVKGKTSGSDGEGDRSKAQVTRTVSGQSGNPALLSQVRGIMADIREIWGLNAAKKADFTSGGQPISSGQVTETLLCALSAFPEARSAAAAALLQLEEPDEPREPASSG